MICRNGKVRRLSLRGEVWVEGERKSKSSGVYLREDQVDAV